MTSRRVGWTITAALAVILLAATFLAHVLGGKHVSHHHSRGMALADATVPSAGPPLSVHPGVAGPRTVPDREADASRRAAAAARDFRQQRGNVFFQRSTFLQGLVTHDADIVANLARFLADPEPLSRVPTDEDYTKSRPPALLDRMAAIDLLEALATDTRASTAARDALADTAARPLDAAASDHVKRLLLAEQYDALTALTHVDAPRAMAIFAALKSPRLAALLEPALVGGLVDTGVPRQDAVALTAELQAVAPH